MSAGGSDYSGVAQGQVGQGFAQGVDLGTQKYLQFKDQLEKKAQQDLDNQFRKQAADSQQATFALKYVDDAVGNILKGSPMPDPSTASVAELEKWADDQRQRYAQLPGLKKAMGTAFTQAGIEVDPDTYLTSMFGGDPTTLLDEQIGKVTGRQNFESLLPKVTALKDQAAQLGAKYGFDSTPYKTAYQSYLDAVNKPDEALGVSLADAWKQATGRNYVDPTANPADFMKGARSSLVNNNVADRLAELATKDETAATILGQYEANGLTASSVVNTPQGQMTITDYVNGFVKNEDLKALINSGKPEDLDRAMSIMYTMPADKRAALPEEFQEAWNTFAKYQSGEIKEDGTIYSRAVTLSKIPRLDYDYKAAQLRGTTVSTDLSLKRFGLEEDAALSQMARDIANGVNVGTDKNKNFFMSKLPEDFTPEQQEEAWNQFYTVPYKKAQDKDTAAYNALVNQVTAGNIANLDASSKLVTNGGLFVAATNDDGTINFSSNAYQLFVKDRGGDTAETRSSFTNLFNMSRTSYNNQDEEARISLEKGRSAVIVGKADADYATNTLDYRTRVAKAAATSAENAADLSGVELDVATQTLTARVAQTLSESRVVVGTETSRILAAKSNATTAEIDAAIAKDTKDAKVRAIKAGATEAEADAYVAELTKNYRVQIQKSQAAITGSQVTIYKNEAVKSEVEAEVAVASKAGRLAQSFNETADLLGPEWLNSGEPERLFGKYLSPAQIKGAKQVAGLRISMKNEAGNLSLLNEYLKNPQVWYKQPAKLRQIAQQAGIDPGAFVSRVTYLAQNANTLSDLEVEGQKTSIWASKKGVSISQANLELARLSRGDRNTQWQAEFDAQDKRDKDAQKWKQKDFDLATANFEVGNAMSIVKLQLEGRSLDIQQQGIVAQFKGVILPTIIEANNLEEGNFNRTTQELTQLIGDNSYIANLVSKLPVNADGVYTVPTNALAQDRPILQRAAELMTARAASQESLKNTGSILRTVTNSLDGTNFSLTDIIGEGQDPDNYVTSGSLKIPTGPTNSNAVIKALDNYGGSTPGSKAVIFGIKAVLTGKAGGGAEIYQAGWCGRYVKTILQTNFDLPAEVNVNANAKGIYDSLVSNGYGVNSGKQITKATDLKDGMVLWQDSPDKDAEGNPVGHIAIYAGGKIWQNSYYKDNKMNGTAVGWMEPEEFLKTYKTYGAQVPDRFAKSGFQGGGTAKPVIPANRPGNKADAAGPAGGGAAAPKAAPAVVKFSDTDGNFATSVNLEKITAGSQNRLVKTPTNNGPLQVRVSNGYRILDPAVATNLMKTVGTQAVMYFDGLASSKGSMPFRKLAAQDPELAVSALVHVLSASSNGQTSPYAGDIRKYAADFLRSKNIIK